MKSRLIESGKEIQIRFSTPINDFSLLEIILQTFHIGEVSRMTTKSTSGMDFTIEQLGHSIIQFALEIAFR